MPQRFAKYLLTYSGEFKTKLFPCGCRVVAERFVVLSVVTMAKILFDNKFYSNSSASHLS
jgi:hypothetical protein